MPYMQNWNFGVEHQITQTLLLELNYQGAKGTHLSSFLSSNDAAPGPGDPNPRRPYPVAGALSELKMIGTSKYNGLTAKAEQRLSKGLTFIASYAFQKNIDLNSQFGGTSPQDNQNIRASMARRTLTRLTCSTQATASRFRRGPFRVLPNGSSPAGNHRHLDARNRPSIQPRSSHRQR